VSAAGVPFGERLVGWQRTHGRHDLPWQNTTDPYRIWLSEIMLQQTQVAAVIPYYERFLSRFPDLAALAKAPLEHVLENWSGLGYYSRARNLHACARQVAGELGGGLPRTVDALARLPGIGRSTAAAIASLAYGVRAPILDGNVKRVLARHAGIEGFPGARAVELRLWDLAAARLPARDIEAYTQGLMDLGATVCTRARPHCDACPVAADCAALATGRTATLPTPRPRKPVPQRAVTMLLLRRQGAVLLERRPPAGIWGGLWSLPELAAGEDAGACCARRFAAEVVVESPLPDIEHGFTHYALTITPQPCTVRRWSEGVGEPGLVWLPLMEVSGAALPAPIKKLLRGLAA
jgi:A/G-specific adenine glycosylase